MLIQAPAKINLTLKIISKRADGYHEISSIMRAIRLFDEAEITLRTGRGNVRTPEIRVRTDTEGVPDGPDNLAYRAAEAALCEWGAWGKDDIPASVDIMLKKRIPVAAGLAGGSSDAAAVLLGLAKAFADGGRKGAVPTLAEIAALGTKLGADVPFCVYACAAANPSLGYTGAAAALAEGIGDMITPLPAAEKAWVLLVKPPIGIPTKDVYALFDERGGPAGGLPAENDFEPICAEVWPVAGETLAALKRICLEEGVEKARVQLSGSGPAVFAYYEGGQEDAALRVHARAKTAFPGMFVCLTETL